MVNFKVAFVVHECLYMWIVLCKVLILSKCIPLPNIPLNKYSFEFMFPIFWHQNFKAHLKTLFFSRLLFCCRDKTTTQSLSSVLQLCCQHSKASCIIWCVNIDCANRLITIHRQKHLIVIDKLLNLLYISSLRVGVSPYASFTSRITIVYGFNKPLVKRIFVCGCF